MSQIPRFWREIPQRYNLTGIECTNCGYVGFPQRSICPECRHESVGKLDAKELAGTGTVETYTVVHDAPAGFELDAPYLMAIVQLEEGPRVTAQIVDCEPDDVDVGTPVKAVFRRVNEEGEAGVVHYGYKFVTA